jgi:hypothetical protein
VTLSRVIPVLRRHRHGDDLHVHLVHPVDARGDDGQAGRPGVAEQPAEPQDHSALVLGDHSDAGAHEHQQPEYGDDDQCENDVHLALRQRRRGRTRGRARGRAALVMAVTC